ncbi:MAG: NAD(P) transhydrogenase subunit alpha [Oligoflexia bacterium]|nr:NAD(P) transhydrogenase subunit alpha [Oligoflexia bacterium]
MIIDGFTAIYIFTLAAFTGYEVIHQVPVILHTPLMSGSNFIHGLILIGAIIALAGSNNNIERIIGFISVLFATINVVGGYVLTIRMLKMFKPKEDSNYSNYPN